jgi:D-serine deaminase-like pyridoxal phosphate-dependent protein
VQHVEDLSDVDEIRPGNFVFYDATQFAIGSCSEEQIAVAVACPVVAKHQERQELIIYGGAVHLSKDVLMQSFELGVKNRHMGRLLCPKTLGGGPILRMPMSPEFPRTWSVKASQEIFARVNVGDLLMVIPVHSCLTANLLRKYVTLKAK